MSGLIFTPPIPSRQFDDKSSPSSAIKRLMPPSQQLQALFLMNCMTFVILGGAALFFPWSFGVFFADGDIDNGLGKPKWIQHKFSEPQQPMEANDPALVHICTMMVRLFGAVLLGFAYLLWHSVLITDARTKKAMIRCYFFICLSISCILIYEHARFGGVMSNGFLPVLKLVFFLALTLGYFYYGLKKQEEYESKRYL